MTQQTLNNGATLLEQRTKINANTAELYAGKAAAEDHASSTANPHSTTKAQVGLGNVDNTSDAAKAVPGNAVGDAIALKYTKPSAGIPATDLATAVRTSLGKADTAAQPADVTAAIANHTTLPDPHPQYQTQTESDARYLQPGALPAGTTLPASQIFDATAAGRNVLTAADAAAQRAAIGLGSVDNTSDANKPVSTAQAAAIAAVVPTPASIVTVTETMTNDQRGSLDGISYSSTQPPAAEYIWLESSDGHVYRSNGTDWTVAA